MAPLLLMHRQCPPNHSLRAPAGLQTSVDHLPAREENLFNRHNTHDPRPARLPNRDLHQSQPLPSRRDAAGLLPAPMRSTGDDNGRVPRRVLPPERTNDHGDV